MPAKSARPLNVFIGCPSDMAAERAELLKLRDHFGELGCPVRFLIWKNATPGAGNPQKVIFDNYPVADWDVFVGLLWTRFGIPSGIHDPLSNEVLTGTEADLILTFAAGMQESRLQIEEERLPVLIRLRQFYRWIEHQRHERKLEAARTGSFSRVLGPHMESGRWFV